MPPWKRAGAPAVPASSLGGGDVTRRANAILALGAGLGASGLAAATDDAKLKSYGRHLAQECSGCHRIDGIDNGIPSIVGWDAERFVATLKFYKTGERKNPVMVSVAGSLDDEQFAALAAYYGSLPKPAPKAKR
jgi:cytochrome c